MAALTLSYQNHFNLYNVLYPLMGLLLEPWECYLLWEYPGALDTHILSPLMFNSCAQTCGQNTSPSYSMTKLSALIPSHAPPAQKRRVVKCGPANPSPPSFQHWAPQAGSPPASQKQRLKKVAGEQERVLYPDAFLCFPWLAAVICTLFSGALCLAVALAPAAT